MLSIGYCERQEYRYEKKRNNYVNVSKEYVFHVGISD